MHENANISFMSQESEKVLATVLSIQPRESGGSGGKSPEETVGEMAKEQEERLPAELTTETAHPSSFAIVEETNLMISLGTCLTQEMNRFNALLNQMATTLAQVQKAIKGTIVMTAELDDMFNAQFSNQVPSVWTKNGIGYPSLKPLISWFEDMIQRVDFFRDWIENGQPISYWASSMYFPQGFLTSVLQGYSRSNMIPVDQLSFEFFPQDTNDPTTLKAAPKKGIYIHGLFIDGADWDLKEGLMCDQEFGTVYVRAPIINFVPWENKLPNPDKYAIPIYKTSVRAGTLSTTGHSTNFVLCMEVDTQEPPSFWVLRGAAMLTMLND